MLCDVQTGRQEHVAQVANHIKTKILEIYIRIIWRLRFLSI